MDYSAQEVVIAAALSSDKKMLGDYYRDIYLQQAIRQGRAPEGASKATHLRERDQFKVMVLGVNYGQTEFGPAARLQVTQPEAVGMLRRYFSSYPDFSRWRQRFMNGVLRRGRRYFTPLG